MAGFFSIILIIFAIILIINFPLATIGLIVGIGIAVWGFKELSINKELGAKSKKPISIVLVGLFIVIGGFSAQASGDEEANGNDNSTSSEVTTEETKESEKAGDKGNTSDNNDVIEEESAEEQANVEEEEAAKKAEEERKAKEAEEAAKKAEEERKAKEAEEAAKKAEEEKKAKEAEEKAKIEREAKKKEEAKAAAEQKKKESETNATVTRVVDGDTLEVNMNGTTETVRLLLIDTPETVHPQKPVEPFGPEASQFVKDTLNGQKVRVQVGSEERDNYGRLLAYVFIDGETIQEKLLRNGLAATAYLYNDLTMLDQFHKVQQTAIDKGIGVWSIPGYAHVDHDHGYHYEEEPEPEPEPTPEPEPVPEPTPAPSSNLQYDPAGPDRDCGDFSSQSAAQAFMEASGPSDPHRLDGNDNDGLACESLN